MSSGDSRAHRAAANPEQKVQVYSVAKLLSLRADAGLRAVPALKEFKLM